MTATFTVDDRWESRAEILPHVELIGPRLGAAVAADLIVRSDTMPGWAVRARFEPLAGAVEMTQHEERRLPAERGIVIDAKGGVVGEIADTVERRPLSTRLLKTSGFRSVRDEAARLFTDAAVLRYLGDGWGRPPLRPGGAQRSPHFFALWASRYVYALGQSPRSPARWIAEADTVAGVHRSGPDVTNQVKRCRPKYLTRSATGRAGGELTGESLRLLAELDIEPGSDQGPVTEGKH